MKIIVNKNGEKWKVYQDLVKEVADALIGAGCKLSFWNDKLVICHEDKKFEIPTPSRLRAVMFYVGIGIVWREGGNVTREDLLDGLAILVAEEVDHVPMI